MFALPRNLQNLGTFFWSCIEDPCKFDRHTPSRLLLIPSRLLNVEASVYASISMHFDLESLQIRAEICFSFSDSWCSKSN